MIKCLIFDNGNVLVKDPYIELLKILEEKYPDKFEDLKAAFKPIGKQGTLGKITYDQYKSGLIKIIGESDSVKVLRPSEPDSEMVGLLKELKKSFTLAMLTNDVSSFRSDNELWHWEAIFEDRIYCSSEIGFSKPDIEIYHYALNKLNFKPEECIYIDDKPRNVEVGKSLGMKGIVFENIVQLRNELGKIIGRRI